MDLIGPNQVKANAVIQGQSAPEWLPVVLDRLKIDSDLVSVLAALTKLDGRTRSVVVALVRSLLSPQPESGSNT